MQLRIKRKIIFALCLHVNIMVIAQSHYISAVVIKNNGDSIAGKIDNRNWNKNAERINFIAGNKKEVVDVDAIKSIYLINEQEKYVSYAIKIDSTPGNYLQAYSSKIASPSFTEKNVFLLQLLKTDSVSLYLYSGGDRNHFYYTTKNEPPVELIYHFLYDENTSEVKTVTTYKQQLFTLMSACTTIAGKIETVRYTEKDLKKIFLDFLKCGNSAGLVEVKKNNRLPLRFGVVGGALYNNFTFVGNGRIHADNYTDYTIGNYKSNLSPLLGVSLDIGLWHAPHNWHIINELVFKVYKTSNSIFTHTVLYDYTDDIGLSFYYLQLNSLLRYGFQIKAVVKPFINIGVGNGLRISDRQNFSHLTYTNGPEKTIVAIDGPEIYEQSLLFGIGLSLKNMQLEGRYAKSGGFSPYVNFKSKVRSPQLVFTYQF